MQGQITSLRPLWSGAVIVAALGYFVDVFDLILFSVVRIKSLKDLGLADAELLSSGVFLINMQMFGMLLGGIAWGILGDKLGRVRVLFGSIVLYSVANLANAFVTSVEMYALLRFIAGFGLAGEIGAGITLVAELLPQNLRSFGTTIVATVGVCGAIFAGILGEYLPWRVTYGIGGVLGLLLLVLRISVSESGLFQSVHAKGHTRGDLRLLFGSWNRLARYAKLIIVGLPTWYLIGILMTFAPELVKAMGSTELPRVGFCIVWAYVGITLGDFVSGIGSHYLQSRRKMLFVFLGLCAVLSTLFLSMKAPSTTLVYTLSAFVGFAGGFWVLTLTCAAEQFGTNLRATVTTTVPNFIRGALVIMTSLFTTFQGYTDIVSSAGLVGVLCIGSAILAAIRLEETYWKDLDFVEE